MGLVTINTGFPCDVLIKLQLKNTKISDSCEETQAPQSF